jgi:DNA-3-methyladenine glycosylase
MRRRRHLVGERAWERIGRGPGCDAQALGLSLKDDGLDLTRGPLWIADAPAFREGLRVARGPRIGIRVARDRPWRFYLEGHPCVSGPRGTPRAPRVIPSRRARRGIRPEFGVDTPWDAT